MVELVELLNFKWTFAHHLKRKIARALKEIATSQNPSTLSIV